MAPDRQERHDEPPTVPPEEGVQHAASTPDGVMTFERDGDAVTFRLRYVDPVRTAELPERSRAAINAGIDRLRAEAIADMTRILRDLLDGLLPQLSTDGSGELPDFEEPTPTAAPDADLEGTLLSVKLPPFGTVMTAADATGSDATLAEEYLRFTIDRRTVELVRLFEAARRHAIRVLEFPAGS